MSPPRTWAWIKEAWATHQPKTVRGSASVCVECDEAWPCTTYHEADQISYDLDDDDIDDIVIPVPGIPGATIHIT